MSGLEIVDEAKRLILLKQQRYRKASLAAGAEAEGLRPLAYDPASSRAWHILSLNPTYVDYS